MPVSTLRELVQLERQSLEVRLEQIREQIAELRANEYQDNMAAMTRLCVEEGEVQVKLKQLTDEKALITHLCIKQEKILQIEQHDSSTPESEVKDVEETRDDSKKAEESTPIMLGDNKTETSTDVLEELKAVRRQVVQLLSEGRLDVAAQKCRDALLRGESSEVAALFSQVALAYRDQKRYPEAEKLLQQALEVQERSPRTNHPSMATTLNNMAAIQVQQKDLTRAEGSFQKALRIWEEAEGEDHPEVALQLVNLALVLQRQGRILEAIPHLERACHINESRLESDDPRLLNTRNALAGAYIRVLRLQEAEEQYKTVLSAVHPVQEELDGKQVAKPVIWKTAEEHEERARTSRRNRNEDTEDVAPLGSATSPATNRALVDLAALYHLQGKHTAAKVLEQYHSCLQPR